MYVSHGFIRFSFHVAMPEEYAHVGRAKIQ